MTACAWCSARIQPTARRDARYCSTSHRQAAFRARIRRSELEATDHPLRIAYADPPYIGMARRYYQDHQDFAGEVDHAALLSRLAMYDGWALSCSAASVVAIAALCVAQDLPARLAVWVRRPPPHQHARVMAGYEAVLYVPARSVTTGSTRQITTALTDSQSARPRTTLPGAVIGMKPPPFAAWLFDLLAAAPGDAFDDLFPGSGIMARYWSDYVGAGDTRHVLSIDTRHVASSS